MGPALRGFHAPHCTLSGLGVVVLILAAASEHEKGQREGDVTLAYLVPADL